MELPSGSLGSSIVFESVTMPMIFFFAETSKSSIVLWYDLDIFCPSVPGIVATVPGMYASGSLKISPKALLNFCARSRVTSRCCFWSFPTGTRSAFMMRMSAAISTGYAKRPCVASKPCAILSL